MADLSERAPHHAPMDAVNTTEAMNDGVDTTGLDTTRLDTTSVDTIGHDTIGHDTIGADTAGDDAIAVGTAPPEDERRGSGIWEIVETLLVALLLFFGMRQIVPSVEVDGLSMVPSLTNTERLLVNRLAYVQWGTGSSARYLFHAPQRGDIVVINPPPRPIEGFWDSFRNQFAMKGPRDEPYIKRIIGLPGDTIHIGDGKVFINGTPIAEDYIKDPPDYTFPLGGMPSLTLGPDQYFVLGDNRRASADSHFFGPIESGRIIGKAWVAIWPWHSFGFLPHRSYPI